MTRGEPIYTDGNDDEPEEVLTRKATSTGATEPATGLAGLTFRISATKGGVAIGSLTAAASERGITGRYFAIFEGADITTALNSTTYWNTDVFQVFGNGADINYNVVRRVLQHRP